MAQGGVLLAGRPRGYWEYIDQYAASYGEIINDLSNTFGAEFRIEHTGGGCMAIEAVFEGCDLLITDADDVLSTMEERREALEAGTPLGYAVGVYQVKRYEDGGTSCVERGDLVGWDSSRDANTSAELCALVRSALDSIGQPI